MPPRPLRGETCGRQLKPYHFGGTRILLDVLSGASNGNILVLIAGGGRFTF